MVHQAKPDISKVLEPGFLQRQHKLVHRTDGDLGIGSAVDQQQGREVFFDVAGGRSFSNPLRQGFLGAGQELRHHFGQTAVLGFPRIQIDGARIADDGLNHAGLILVRTVALKAVRLAGHAEQQGQVATGRVAISADAVHVNVVLLRMGAQPPRLSKG